MGASDHPLHSPIQFFQKTIQVLSAALMVGAIASCSASSPGNAASSDASSSTSGQEEAIIGNAEETGSQATNETIAQNNQESRELSSEWVAASAQDEDAQWSYILNSPLGIAALNQLAIEGFINPLCEKSFYINEQTGGFQSLMKVECSTPRGASTAVGYDEVHVIFNRFESNIENFEIRRFGQS